MAKRMWVNKFRFYLRLGTIPIFIIGIVLLSYPKIFFSIVKHSDFNINIFNLFFFKIFRNIIYLYFFYF